mmetsp:Transcript_21900/g.65627  ORF Transcript_21900/g.65627 Transcript_21900/m.65627 type:complete len:202 (-) Transcript_21900:1970-2575(-)
MKRSGLAPRLCSEWRTPWPADMNWMAPRPNVSALPPLSACVSSPSTTYVTISMSRWPCVPKPRAGCTRSSFMTRKTPKFDGPPPLLGERKVEPRLEPVVVGPRAVRPGVRLVPEHARVRLGRVQRLGSHDADRRATRRALEHRGRARGCGEVKKARRRRGRREAMKAPRGRFARLGTRCGAQSRPNGAPALCPALSRQPPR